jgi:cobalt-zinc-cadmium efflux system outer membrane protein
MGLSFPLPLWNLNRGNIQAAQAGVAQFEQALGKARTQAMADIATAQVEYDEASARWTRYRDVTAPKSAQVLKSVQFAYDKGGAALLALLDAERTDNDIRLATVQAMSDTTGAIADLVAARNVLPETELMERDK